MKECEDDGRIECKIQDAKKHVLFLISVLFYNLQ